MAVWIVHFLYFISKFVTTFKFKTLKVKAPVRLQLNISPLPIRASTLLVGPTFPSLSVRIFMDDSLSHVWTSLVLALILRSIFLEKMGSKFELKIWCSSNYVKLSTGLRCYSLIMIYIFFDIISIKFVRKNLVPKSDVLEIAWNSKLL